MKNLDFKKLLVFIGIIAVIGLAIFFIIKLSNNSKATKEEKKTAENLSISYYANLTEGYSTLYGGLDVLFQSDETTFKDLSIAAVLNTAIKYAEYEGIDTSVSNTAIDLLEEEKKYKNLNDFTFYRGEAIRQAIKELFGDVEYVDQSAEGIENYIYDIIYEGTYDLYLVRRNETQDIASNKHGIDYTIIDTKSKDDKIITKIAIAYTYSNTNSKSYSKDKNGSKIIVKEAKEFPTDKAEEFDNFEITLKKTKENKYVFESIKKVK